MRAIEHLRDHIYTEEFDYGLLMNALKSYSKPRDAVSKLLQQKAIERVKKGYYVFGKRYRKGPISLEVIANLIYGPSYISLEYALSYYGLIPERVHIITSITPLRNKTFNTPLGIFEYQHLNADKTSVGVTFVTIDSFHHMIIATPEKALADRLAPHLNLCSPEDVYHFVCKGLRVEEESLSKFNIVLLEEINEIYRNPAVSALTQLIKEF